MADGSGQHNTVMVAELPGEWIADLEHTGAEFAGAVQMVCRTADRVHAEAVLGNRQLAQQQQRLNALITDLEARARLW